MTHTDVEGQLHGHAFCAGPQGSVLGSFIRQPLKVEIPWIYFLRMRRSYTEHLNFKYFKVLLAEEKKHNLSV